MISTPAAVRYLLKAERTLGPERHTNLLRHINARAAGGRVTKKLCLRALIDLWAEEGLPKVPKEQLMSPLTKDDLAFNDGRAYRFDGEGRILAPKRDELINGNSNEGLDNGSTTDTLQWCELHCGHCHDVVPVRRRYPDYPDRTHIFLACQNCVRDLKKAGLLQDSKYARHECYEIVVPKGLCKGRKVAPSTRRTKSRHSKTDRSLLRSRQQSYEVTLDALQVKYLRALGLLVIPA